MSKTDRIYIRLEAGEKTFIAAESKRLNISSSDYVRRYGIPSDSHLLTHEQMIINTFPDNHFYNDLMTNKGLSNKAKQIISKELKKHV